MLKNINICLGLVLFSLIILYFFLPLQRLNGAVGFAISSNSQYEEKLNLLNDFLTKKGFTKISNNRTTNKFVSGTYRSISKFTILTEYNEVEKQLTYTILSNKITLSKFNKIKWFNEFLTRLRTLSNELPNGTPHIKPGPSQWKVVK